MKKVTKSAKAKARKIAKTAKAKAAKARKIAKAAKAKAAKAKARKIAKAAKSKAAKAKARKIAKAAKAKAAKSKVAKGKAGKGKNIPSNPKLYEKAKRIVYKMYPGPSAYRSGALVKKYKELGGKYTGTKKDKQKSPLGRWFKEEWKDINPKKTKTSYPVYRPTKRITKDTPLTVKEIKKSRILEQSKLKQRLKQKKLPPFGK